ncbi:hypothetical protein EZMO1_2544 [Endozoicomonas montiporae CL-33]|uniref:Uncharacterized protein n=1 Tax=Endozoicomonas montiporae CL-33 TaxID=570277 RepID=A0A142BCZ7_9GAMM|nr:hypothetical protein EZMO1_2544 [Endozoicomonas montiporae CL-33]
MLNKLTDYKFVVASALVAVGVIYLSNKNDTVRKLTGK